MPRTVSVAIVANTSGFTAGMSKVASSATAAANSVKGSFAQGFAAIGKNSGAIDSVAGNMAKIGAVGAVGIGVAVKAFANFDKAMSSVKATGSDAAANFDALREAAVNAGAATQFSATEAAGAIEELSKAGVSAKDTLGGGLNGALDLAAAGTLDVGNAAEIAASAMNQFGLSGQDVPHIADLLAQAAGTAQGEVSDMAAALNQSGLVANQFGLSIDETTQALALFAKNGLVGSDAGTSFKTALTALYAPTATAAKTLDALGISAYDASGAMLPIGDLADQIKDKLGGLSDADQASALKNIFGSDAIRVGSILLKEGSAGLDEMATAFGTFGSAADVARTKMDNLSGDIEQLKGSLETALIGLGEGANGPLRSLVQNMTGAVNAFSGLSSGTKGAILAVAGIGSAGLIASAGVLKLATTVSSGLAAFQALSTNAPRAAAALSGVGKAAGIAVGAFIALEGAAAATRAIDGVFTPSVEGATAALLKLGDASGIGAQVGTDLFQITTNSGLLSKTTVGVDSLGSAFQRLNQTNFNDSFNEKFDSMFGTTEATTTKIKLQLSALDQGLIQLGNSGKGDAAAASFVKIADAAKLQGTSTEALVKLFPEYAASVTSMANANGIAVTSSDQLVGLMTGALPGGLEAVATAAKKAADATKSAGPATDAYTTALSGGAEALQAYADAAQQTANALLGLSGSQIGMESAIDAATAAAKENGDTLNVNTEAGRANKQALNDLAAATLSYTNNLIQSGASANEIVSANERGRASFVKTAEAMGQGAKAANALADDLFALPKEITSQVVVKGAKVSQQQADDLNKAISKLPAETRANIVTIANTKGAKAARAAIEAVKDKTVIARSKGDLKGAKQVDAAMKALKDRLVKAVSRGDTKGAAAVRTAMAALKSRTVTAGVRADTSGARAAQSAVNSVHGKTVIITTHYRSTGSPGKTLTASANAAGGYISGPGGPTDDLIPAWLSNGEFVIRAAAVKAVGLANLHAINSKGYAAGGAVKGGRAAFATGGPVGATTTEIMRLIAALQNPLGDIAKLAAQVTAANKTIAKPTARYQAALKAYDKATDKRDDLRDRVNQLKKEADATKGTTKADRDLKKARNDLAVANASVSKTSKEKTAATTAYNKVAGKSKELTDALKQAQAALADSARQAAETLAGPYRSASLDVDDILEAMKAGTVDLAAFNTKLKKLRSLGLSETLVQQIVAQGAVRGGEVADQIIAGGSKLAATLTTANKALEKAADTIGYTAVTKPVRKASGGFIAGAGTGLSDSIPARLSNGEYVVNAAATAANRGVLDAINYGRAEIRGDYLPAFRTGGYVQQPAAQRVINQGDVHLHWRGNDVATAMRQARNAQRDALTMASLSTVGV